MISLLVYQSNSKLDNGYPLKKLGIEVGLYFATRGKAKDKKKAYFYRSLNELCKKVATFSSRQEISKNAMSEALTALDKYGLIKYEKDVPKNIEKHGGKRGIRVVVMSREHYICLKKEG
ncbi:hypothetical protein [Paraglaciecola algarum]|nr:hypothetical protein [Paraglaciecola sp. G1-23]